MAALIHLTSIIIVLQLLSTGFGLDPNLENKEISFDFSLVLKKGALPTDTSSTETTTFSFPVTSTSTPATTSVTSTTVTNGTNGTNATAATAATTDSTSTPEPSANTTVYNSTMDYTETSPTEEVVTTSIAADTTSETDSTTARGAVAMMLTEERLQDTAELIRWLTSIFNETIGFSKLTYLSLNDFPRVSYKVSYKVATLSQQNALGADGKLTKDLRTIAKVVSRDSRSFDGIWIIDENTTQQAMDTSIASASTSLKSVCDMVSFVCRNLNFTCIQQKSGNVACVHRCTLFLQKNQCEKQGFLATGKCELNENVEPYCNCGSYLLLDNFFTGDKCINVSLIVAFTAGGSALLLLTCIIAICCLVSKMRKCRAKRSQSCNVEHKTCFDPPPTDYMEGTRSNGRVAYPPLSGEQKVSSDRRCRSTLDIDGGHMNQGYQSGDRPLPADIDPTQSEAYNTFFPNLEAVDTTLKFAIKRPNVMIRPTNNYAHVQQHGYAEERF